MSFDAVKMTLYTDRKLADLCEQWRPFVAWVHEQIFAAGGGHIPATWDQFSHQMNIKTVIHLSKSTPMDFNGGWPDRFLWLAIEGEKDSDSAARELCGRFVQDAVAQGQNVLLHSSHGRHRTRWIYVAFLLCSGRQLRAALRLAEEKPWQAPYHTDRESWETFKHYLREL
jgi:hypothetical protein